MKVFLLLFLPPSIFAFSERCEVYGITHAPQELDCSFSSGNVYLTCRNGTYFLNEDLVSSAYHLEVEEGSSPLVFETFQSRLIVTDLLGELEVKKVTVRGQCL
jgi:hypothetical protein